MFICTIIKNVKLDKANYKSINIVLKDDLSVVESVDGKEHKYTYDINIDDIRLPIKKGDVIGKINVLENKKIVSSSVLTTDCNINKLNFFDLFYNSLLDTFSGQI